MKITVNYPTLRQKKVRMGHPQELVTLCGICVTVCIGVLRLRCAPLRMTLKNKSKIKGKVNYPTLRQKMAEG